MSTFGEKFNPSDPDFDRDVPDDNELLQLPGGKRTLNDKFALTYYTFLLKFI